jgi:hypothetical protein
VPTVMAAAGVPDVKEKLLTGYKAGDKTYKVHLDGYNQLPYLSGQSQESARREFFYYGEANLYAIRVNDWKIHFQTKNDWFGGQAVTPTVPRPVNLRADPFEQHMGRQTTRSTLAKNYGRSCRRPRSCNSTSTHSKPSHNVKIQPVSMSATPWGKHCELLPQEEDRSAGSPALVFVPDGRRPAQLPRSALRAVCVRSATGPKADSGGQQQA